jgi:hypothetical protein
MKLVFGCLLLLSGNGYCFVTEKDPSKMDISINIIVERTCISAGYFNPFACVDSVRNCYNKQIWPKTVSVEYKIDVVNHCINKYIRH